MYWQERAQSNEEHAAKLAAKYSKSQERYYKDAYKRIAAELNRFYTSVADGEVSRTELWNYVRYQQLLEQIQSECKAIGVAQNEIMDAATAKIFEDTIGRTLEDFLGKDKSISLLDVDLMKDTLDANWAGKNYSERIWNNTNVLATRLSDDIQSMIAIGKSPGEIKKQIQRDFNVSYSQADRLIRTEASYVYNTAAIKGYKKSGVKQVQVLVEHNACDSCREYDGLKFDINEAPLIPVHPNCRCCYIPIVE